MQRDANSSSPGSLPEPQLLVAKKESRRFKLARWSKVLLAFYLLCNIAYVAVVFSVGFVSAGTGLFDRPDVIGQMMGGYILAPLIFVFVAWGVSKCVFMLTRRQSSAAPANAVFIFIVLLLIMVSWGRCSREIEERRRNEAVFSQLSIETEVLKGKLREAIESGDELTDRSALFQRWLSAFEQGAQSASGEDAAVFHGIGVALRMLEVSGTEYERALAKFFEAGALDVSKVRRIEELERRIESARNARDASARFADAVYKSEERFANDLRAQGVSAGAVVDARVGFRKGADVVLQSCDMDRRALAASMQLLELLRQSWGAWAVDQIEDFVIFEDDATSERYNHLVARIDELYERQEQLQLQRFELLSEEGED